MARWDPWSDLFNLQSELARWANEGIGNGPYLGALAGSGRSVAAAPPVAYLPLDIRQREGEFVIEASVPGFTPEEVEVTADQGLLTIRGERKVSPSDQSDGTYLRRERGSYSVMRQLTLPADVKEEEIRASFANGVLTVHLPKAAVAAPRRIPVGRDETGAEPQVIEAGAGQA